MYTAYRAKVIFPLLFCFLAKPWQIIAQFELNDIQPEQLEKRIDSLIDYGMAGDSTYVYRHVTSLLEKARNNRQVQQIAKCFKSLGLVEAYNKHPSLAVTYYDSAYHYFKLAKDTAGLVSVLVNVGDPMSSIGMCLEAAQGYNEADQLLQKGDRVYAWLVLKFHQAQSHLFCDQYELSIQFGKEAIPIAQKEKQDYLLGMLSDIVGQAYTANSQAEFALRYFSKALIIAEKLQDDDLKSGIYNNRGEAYLLQKLPQKAYSDFKKSLEVGNRSEWSIKEDGVTYISLGKACVKLGKIQEGIPYFEQGLTMLREKEDLIVLADAYAQASEAYALNNQNKKAFEALKQSKYWQDSLLNAQMQKELNEITEKYENEKLKGELTQASLVAERRKGINQRFAAILGLSILSIIFLYFFFTNRQKRIKALSERKRIELEYGLLRAKMNPHFLFNSLNSIQAFFAQNQFRIGNEFLSKFSILIRKVLDQCNKSSITLAEEIETLKLYMELERLRLQNQFDYSIDIDSELETEFIEIPPLILQPFVENAIWHGISPKNSPGMININIALDHSQALSCTIKDNGVGLKAEKFNQEHLSSGIKITEERLGPNGHVKLTNMEDDSGHIQGVEVSLKIPLSTH